MGGFVAMCLEQCGQAGSDVDGPGVQEGIEIILS